MLFNLNYPVLCQTKAHTIKVRVRKLYAWEKNAMGHILISVPVVDNLTKNMIANQDFRGFLSLRLKKLPGEDSQPFYHLKIKHTDF